MGYTLDIGEAVVDWTEDLVRIGVEPVRLDEAPAFNEPTDHTNSRWPSYSSWAEFCRELGITDVMLNERNGGGGSLEISEGVTIYPLMQGHPGVAPITPHHLAYIEQKLQAYKEKHPDHIAQYPPLKPGVEDKGINPESDYVDDPRFDGTLCRAEWLVFWLRWALDNCEKPVFVNT